jgi:gliding motility-associated-like protein
MKRWLVIALNVFVFSLSAQTISSTFDTNADGWTAVDDPFGLPVTLTTRANGGVNNSGCISLRDNIPLGGSTFFFSAPAKFLGNKSWAYNNTLSFDMRLIIGTTTFGGDNVVIEGANGVKLIALTSTPTAAWGTITVPMNETSWHIGTRTARFATKQEFLDVLCNIRKLWIRGEYYNGNDEGFLDNVILNVQTPCYEVLKQDISLCAGKSVKVNGKLLNATGVYQDTVKKCFPQCDSIYDTKITIINPISRNIDTTVCANAPLVIYGKTYTQSGTFTDIVRTATGCDSLNLTIKVTIRPTPSSAKIVAICAGEVYTIGNNTYNTEGIYQDTFRATTGCDSVVTTVLRIKQPSFYLQNFTICPGGVVRVGTKSYTTTGFYRDTLRNFQGCDSVIVTNVTVKAATTYTQNIRICKGEALNMGSKSYTITGIYKDTLQNAVGCDSIVTTNLTVIPPLSIARNLVICQGGSVRVGNNIYNRTGIYIDTLKTITGCDSIVTLDLKVNNTYTETQVASICSNSSYKIGANTYRTAGTYRDTFKTINGCDSIIITDLIVKTSATKTQNITLCTGGVVRVGVKNYTQTGVYRDTFRSFSGCDSIVVTNLTINPISVKNQNLRICQGEIVQIGLKTYATTGIFKDTLQNWLGCDSIVTTNLTVALPLSIAQKITICEGQAVRVGTKSYNQTGIYKDTLKSIAGCDSVVTTNLTVGKGTTVTRNVSICPSETYRVGSSMYKTAGTYRDTFNTWQGCDSIIVSVLTLKTAKIQEQTIAICEGDFYKVGSKLYRASGIYRDTFQGATGCDSILTTNLTVKTNTTRTQNIDLCKGETYRIGFNTYSQAGTFKDILTNRQGCDSVVTTTIKIIDPLSISQNISICEGDFYRIGNKTYRQTGVFKDTLKSITAGCDSIVTTNLRVNKKFNETQNVSICPNGVHRVGAINYTLAGTYRDTFRSITGCDSVITTVLSIKNIPTRTQNITLCNGQSLKVGTKTYTQTGIYVDTLRAAGGCDSVVTTNLKVENIFSKTQSLEVCEGTIVRVGFKSYTVSGIYIDTLRTVTGCDSIVATFLKVNRPFATTQNANICPNSFFTVGTRRYTQSGTYRDTLKAITGCDSVVTTVVKVQQNTTLAQNVALCAGQSYKIGLKTYTQAGQYRDTLRNYLGCDSLVLTTLTINTSILKNQNFAICTGDAVKVGNRVYIQAGTFKDTLRAVGGCDSIITTVITVKSTGLRQIDTTICAGKTLIINGKSYDKTGLFRDAITRAGSCDSIISIALTVKPYTIQKEDVVICPEDSVFSNGRLVRNVGVYRDTIVQSQTCDYILELTISKSLLRVNLGADLTLVQGDSVQLTPSVFGTQNTRLKWQTNSSLKCTTCPSPTVKPTVSTVYTLEVTDSLTGCRVRDAVQVFVKSCASAYMPTAFSPNDDGQNDYFTVYGTGCIRQVKKMQVFNRWGALVYSKENFLPNSDKDGWDGMFNNKALPTDVYAYVVEVELPEGKTERIWGDVTLVR